MTRESTRIGSVGGEAERRHAADLHAGQLHHRLGAGERRLADAHLAPHDVVDVERRRRQHDAGDVRRFRALRGDDDRVGAAIERDAVGFDERGRVGQGGVAFHDLEVDAERRRARRGRADGEGRRPASVRRSRRLRRTIARPGVGARAGRSRRRGSRPAGRRRSARAAEGRARRRTRSLGRRSPP